MVSRLLLPIAFISLSLSAADADSGRYISSECLAFPAGEGFFADTLEIVMRASGALKINADIKFKACRPLGEKPISLRRLAAYSDYRSEIRVIRAGDGARLTLENTVTELGNPPLLGGGQPETVHYTIPPLLIGDELHETVRASVPPVLSGNQFWVQGLPGVQDVSSYTVVFKSERSDVTARLIDTAKLLVQVDDAPARKEWRSERPTAGISPDLSLEMTTLDTWASVARQLRAAYFMDSQSLKDLRATNIQPTRDPEALFKAFTDRFGTVTTSEHRVEPRSLASILQTRGGDCKSLTFLLLNLFRWSGTDAELVLISQQHRTNLSDVFSFTKLDHALVYVPSADRYFDPTLPAGWQQRQLDRTIRTQTRIHLADPLDGNFHAGRACADYCTLTGTGESANVPIPVKTETIRSYQ